MKGLLLLFLLGIHTAMAMPEAEVEEVVSVEDSPYVEMESGLLQKYYAKKPNQFLIDPQAFVSNEQRKSLEKILNNHSADSAIDLYLFVLGGNQKLPAEGLHKDFVDRHFSQGKPVVLLYYYFENPMRTEMVLSPGIAKIVSSSEQQRSVQSSLIRAMRANGSFEQLEEFVMQFSVRTYWMERMMEEPAAETEQVAAVEEKPVAPGTETKLNLLERIPEKYREPALMAAAGLGSILVLSALIFWLRSRARYKFPELDVEARLGGSHAAGIGAVVNFASSAVSPARQREQVPEYLRRV